MPGPNSPQSFSEARKEFKKQKKQKQKKQKKQSKRQRVSKKRKAVRHRSQAVSQLSRHIVKARKKKKTKKAKGKGKGKASQTIRCDCGDKSYTGSELTPRGLGHCEECTLENVIRRGVDGKLYRNTGDQESRKWVKV